MTDSNARDRLEAKRTRNREQRIEAVKRWAEYIRSEPSEKWGPQQNAIVDGQLEAAQQAAVSASHRQRVETLAAEIREAKEE